MQLILLLPSFFLVLELEASSVAPFRAQWRRPLVADAAGPQAPHFADAM